MQALDQKFWARFAKSAWEKKSITVQNISSPLLELNEVEIFKLLVAYSDRCRRLKSADGMKFYIDGQRQFETEVLRHLPKKSDRSLIGYHDRMNSQYEDYCLVCDELLQVSDELQESLELLTSQLFANVGMPNRFVEMGLYLGNYQKTPFGVHEDPCGVFSFPVVGKKKFRIWEPGFVQKNPGLAQSFSYAKYKKASQVLEANPGDMAYWPSSAWHIAESDGSFSATWSLGVWVDKKMSEVVSEVTGPIFKNLLGALGDACMTPYPPKVSDAGEVQTLPANYRQTLTALQSLSKKELQSAFREAWMKSFSKRGFKNSPLHEVAFQKSSQICLRNPKRPIYWMKDGSDIIYGFNGAIVRTSSKSFFRWITEINEGKSLRAEKAFQELKELARVGAFKLASSKQPKTRDRFRPR